MLKSRINPISHSHPGRETGLKVTATMGSFARKLAVVFAAGYILFFYSERVFWSFLRPGDKVVEILITWMVLGMGGSEWFRSARWELPILLGLIGLFFVGVRVPATPRSALILPPLLVACAEARLSLETRPAHERFRIRQRAGAHHRRFPIKAMLVNLAQPFDAGIKISLDGRKADAKSIMSLLVLGSERLRVAE
jgi:phosphotransferase system HPr (HPr) family protein